MKINFETHSFSRSCDMAVRSKNKSVQCSHTPFARFVVPDRQAGRQEDKQAGRKTGREAGRKTSRQASKQAGRQTGRRDYSHTISFILTYF